MGKEKMRQSCTKSRLVRPPLWPPIYLGPVQGRKGPGCVCPSSALTPARDWFSSAEEAEKEHPTGTEAMRETSYGTEVGMREVCEQMARKMQNQEGEGSLGAPGGK